MDSVSKLSNEHGIQAGILVEQKTLIEQLESDLYALQELSHSSLRQTSASLNEMHFCEPDFVTDAMRSESGGWKSPVSGITKSDEEAYLPILQRQNQRYHRKLKQLEEMNHDLQSKLIALKNQLESLSGDNVRLYERVRFLQSYEGRKVESRINVLASVDSGAKEAENRYSSAYERNLDPFASFHRAEKSRKYDALGPVDKATLAMGQTVLGSPNGRKVFFFYALILHLLVFAIIYKLALNESNLRDFSYDCATRFANHMQHVHGKA